MSSPDTLTSQKERFLADSHEHLRAIAYIERHLFEPLDIASIAAAVGYSASQFSRRFTRIQGETAMAYVRGRRLEVAARRIIDDPAARLIEIAIECGFKSQEAFTRAFTRAFGSTPGRLQRSRATTLPRRNRVAVGVVPTLTERVESRPDIVLVGLRRLFSPANYTEMAALWEQLVEFRQKHGQTRRSESYGVVVAEDDDGTIEFLAATELPDAVEPGPPFESLVLPGGDFRVFRHVLRDGHLLAEMNAAADAIAARLVSGGHRVPEGRIAFKRYPEHFGLRNRYIDHYFPVTSARRGM
jgi:AraC family transcriptional regulator